MRMDHYSRHDFAQNAVVRFFADGWKEWKNRRARLAAFDRADANEMARIARDLGTPLPELRRLVGSGAHSADLLLDRMRSLNLDPAKVEPAVMRDLQRCCAGCLAKTLCAHELEDRPKGARWPQYCPNELTIAALQSDNQGDRP
jgi:hypothetical protein